METHHKFDPYWYVSNCWFPYLFRWLVYAINTLDVVNSSPKGQKVEKTIASWFYLSKLMQKRSTIKVHEIGSKDAIPFFLRQCKTIHVACRKNNIILCKPNQCRFASTWPIKHNQVNLDIDIMLQNITLSYNPSCFNNNRIEKHCEWRSAPWYWNYEWKYHVCKIWFENVLEGRC